MTEDYEASLEDHLYEAIGDPKATRDDIAALYALGLRRSVIEEFQLGQDQPSDHRQVVNVGAALRQGKGMEVGRKKTNRGNMTRRVIVCGGRHYNDAANVAEILARYLRAGDTLVVGDATGADELAREWAKKHGFKPEVHRANWRKYGKAAGPIRNGEMVARGADLLIAFPGERGTANCVEQAHKHGIPTLAVGEIRWAAREGYWRVA